MVWCGCCCVVCENVSAILQCLYQVCCGLLCAMPCCSDKRIERNRIKSNHVSLALPILPALSCPLSCALCSVLARQRLNRTVKPLLTARCAVCVSYPVLSCPVAVLPPPPLPSLPFPSSLPSSPSPTFFSSHPLEWVHSRHE